MAFEDGTSFLAFAEILALTPNDSPNLEAAYRSAISRAYVAAFLCARNYLQNKGVVVLLDDTAHAQVRREFQTRSKRVETHLHRLRGWRNGADYDVSFNATKSQVDNASNATQPVIYAINQLS